MAGEPIRMLGQVARQKVSVMLPVAGVHNLGTPGTFDYRWPRAVTVDSPSPSAAFKSILCHTPGTLRYERPVDGGTHVTISVQVRVSTDYLLSDGQQLGSFFYRTIPMLPFMRVTRSDGLQVTDVMNSVVDTWDTLSCGLDILDTGVVLVELVQLGTSGDNSTFAPTNLLAALEGPKCYWAGLTATEP